VDSKLRDLSLDQAVVLHPVDDFEEVVVGGIAVQFLPVAHSVPMSHALVLRTSSGTLLHSGDFKLDPDPVDGRTTALRTMAAIADDEGIRLLLADSTNAEEPGWTESEREVHPALADAFDIAHGRRIVATCFASHIHRITQIVDVALRSGRRIVPVGRSMERVFGIARDMGLIDVPDSAVVDQRQALGLPAGEICIICTGSQGEPRSALVLMSTGQHRSVRLTAEDVVLISADAIPGNEPDVGRLLDNLARTGAHVLHAGIAKVHVSGHAKSEELERLIEVVKPRALIPVHGEYRHMRALLELSMRLPGGPEDVRLCEDGSAVLVSEDQLEILPNFPAEQIYVTQRGTEDAVDAAVVAVRQRMAVGSVAVLLVRDDTDSLRVSSLRQFGWVTDSAFARFKDDATDACDKLLRGRYVSRITTKSIQAMSGALGAFGPARPFVCPIELE